MSYTECVLTEYRVACQYDDNRYSIDLLQSIDHLYLEIKKINRSTISSND